MKTLVRCLTFLLLLALSCNAASSPGSVSRETYKSLLDRVMEALVKVAEFFEASYSDVNMDGLYCVRLGQGILTGVLDDCARCGCEEAVVDTIQDTIVGLDEFGAQALPSIKNQNEVYYNTFLTVINETFMVKYIPERLHGARETVDTNATYDGITGNYCFGDILGTRQINGSNVRSCTITDDCWNFMSRTGTVGYYTTHQLLYCIYAEHNGCEKNLEQFTQNRLGISLRQFEKRLCEQIFIDAKFRERDGKMNLPTEDLFLEQIALCGGLGFEDFFDLSWMEMVLSWQTERGCFTVPSHFIEIEDSLEKNDDQIRELKDQLSKGRNTLSQTELDSIKQSIDELWLERSRIMAISETDILLRDIFRGTFTSRNLLSEKVMGGDCLAHKSGLGAATLAAYARFLLRKLQDC